MNLKTKDKSKKKTMMKEKATYRRVINQIYQRCNDYYIPERPAKSASYTTSPVPRQAPIIDAIFNVKRPARTYLEFWVRPWQRSTHAWRTRCRCGCPKLLLTTCGLPDGPPTSVTTVAHATGAGVYHRRMHCLHRASVSYGTYPTGVC